MTCIKVKGLYISVKSITAVCEPHEPDKARGFPELSHTPALIMTVWTTGAIFDITFNDSETGLAWDAFRSIREELGEVKGHENHGAA